MFTLVWTEDLKCYNSIGLRSLCSDNLRPIVLVQILAWVLSSYIPKQTQLREKTCLWFWNNRPKCSKWARCENTLSSELNLRTRSVRFTNWIVNLFYWKDSNTFTFSHLADAFIQSDLQMRTIKRKIHLQLNFTSRLNFGPLLQKTFNIVSRMDLDAL